MFLTDIDSIWLKYLKLEGLIQFADAIHAKCPSWPKQVSKSWGFVVCGGVAGYRSNQNTIELFRFLHSRCLKMCDDQKILNDDACFRHFQIEWNEFGDQIDILATDELPIFSYGIASKLSNLKTVVLSDQVISRMPKFECNSLYMNSWIISPSVPKTLTKKLELYKKFESCVKKHNDSRLVS